MNPFSVLVLIAFLFIAIPAYGQFGWIEFSPPDSGFTVKLPEKPQGYTDNIQGSSSHSFTVASGFIGYFVGYTDLPPPKTGTRSISEINVRLNDSRNGILNRTKTRLLNEDNVSLAGYPGKKFISVASDGVIFNSRVYIAKDRLYVLTVVAAPKYVYRKEVMYFFDSFALK